MLAAIERGRTPAIDYLNGEVVERSRAVGLRAPANAKVREVVWRIAEGKERPSLELLRSVHDAVV